VVDHVDVKILVVNLNGRGSSSSLVPNGTVCLLCSVVVSVVRLLEVLGVFCDVCVGLLVFLMMSLYPEAVSVACIWLRFFSGLCAFNPGCPGLLNFPCFSVCSVL
jgi:hypothetical protein